MAFSRRDFLKRLGILSGAAVVAPALPLPEAAPVAQAGLTELASGGFVDSLTVLPYTGPTGVFMGEGRVLIDGTFETLGALREVIAGEPIEAGSFVTIGEDGYAYNFKVTQTDE